MNLRFYFTKKDCDEILNKLTNKTFDGSISRIDKIFKCIKSKIKLFPNESFKQKINLKDGFEHMPENFETFDGVRLCIKNGFKFDHCKNDIKNMKDDKKKLIYNIVSDSNTKHISLMLLENHEVIS